MAEAVHTVEQVVEYKTMVETIRHQNNDLKARLTQGQQELLEILVCPITQEVTIDPVLTADNHTYERQAIELWLRNNNRSPLDQPNVIPQELGIQLVDQERPQQDAPTLYDSRRVTNGKKNSQIVLIKSSVPIYIFGRTKP